MDTPSPDGADTDPLAVLSNPAQLDQLIRQAESTGDVAFAVQLKRQKLMRTAGETARADNAARFINTTKLRRPAP